MFRTQGVLWLVVMNIGLIHAWDIAVSHGDLLEFYTNETKIDTIRIHSHNLAALAYDEVHNMVLYVDKQRGNDAICGLDISSIESKCFVERNTKNIHGLAFDPASQILFFTDTNERTINWISLKPGSKNNVFGNHLIKMDHGIPTDIAVDSCRGYVYWINTNLATPTIERARFNGSEREVIINIKSFSINTSHKLEPHSLTIDQQGQKMYWIEPWDSSTYHIHSTDLNGKNETHYCRLLGMQQPHPSSNVLAVSKTFMYYVAWGQMFAEKFRKSKFMIAEKKRFQLNIRTGAFGVVANYKIKERIQNIDDCEALTSLELNYSDVPFCVHGVKVIGQSLCKCSPGYIGDRCDVSVCDNNYCLQGNCSVSDEGLPECRCDAGYLGNRCEVETCRDFCLNSGVCSLNEEDEASCECVGRYEGPRCEAVRNDNPASTKIPIFSAGTNITLADLLTNWRKPKILLIVDGV